MWLDVASQADVLRLVTHSSPKNVCIRGYNRLDEAVVVVGHWETAISECYQYFPEVNFRGKYLWITQSNHDIKFGAVLMSKV